MTADDSAPIVPASPLVDNYPSLELIQDTLVALADHYAEHANKIRPNTGKSAEWWSSLTAAVSLQEAARLVHAAREELA